MTTIPTPARTLARTGRLSLPGGQRWLPVAALAAALLVAAAAWILLVAPVRQDAAGVAAQAATVTTRADALERQLAALQAEQGDLPTFRSELAAAQAALPNTAALPDFLRTLQTIGTTSGVEVTVVNAMPPVPLTGAGSNGAGSNGASGGAGAVSNGAATGTAVGPVYQVAITLTATGAPAALSTFIATLQSDQPRAVLITGFDQTSGGDGTSLNLSLVAFVAPQSGATPPSGSTGG